MTTIAERIAERNRVWINCGVSNHSHEIDLEQLAGRLGADHGAMHDDLTPKFTCRRCADRGERRRDIFMTVPDYGRIAGRLNNWSEPPGSLVAAHRGAYPGRLEAAR